MQIFIQTRASVTPNDDTPWITTTEYKAADGVDLVNRAINAVQGLALTMTANTMLRLHIHDHDREFATGWIGGCRVLEYARRGGPAVVVRDNLTEWMADNPATRDDIDNKVDVVAAERGR